MVAKIYDIGIFQWLMAYDNQFETVNESLTKYIMQKIYSRIRYRFKWPLNGVITAKQ